MKCVTLWGYVKIQKKQFFELFLLRVHQYDQTKLKNESGQYVEQIHTKGLRCRFVEITLQPPSV